MYISRRMEGKHCVIANIALACVLVFVGMLLYKETITLRQIIGMLVCAAGLYLIGGG